MPHSTFISAGSATSSIAHDERLRSTGTGTGVRLGRYLVLQHLASGGMADVLLGRADGIAGFRHHVVLKRIRAEHAQDRRFVRMLLDEARIAATLHHQNIVQVHDVGEATGEYFIAMEHIHGENLRAMLETIRKRRAHMPLDHVLAIIAAAAAGLHYAHERRGNRNRPLNIVHRDVSLSNILVGYDGSIKIVDFGIAKAASRQTETESRCLIGKVGYMSPEQCRTTAIDRRSDVYSLGVVFYELATTTRLFANGSDYDVMDQIINGRVPLPRVRRPDLPNELAMIIMRALMPDPDQRFQTADQLRLAVEHYASNRGLTTSTSALARYLRQLFGEKPEPWFVTEEPDEIPIEVETRSLELQALEPSTPARDLARERSVDATDRAKIISPQPPWIGKIARVGPLVIVALVIASYQLMDRATPANGRPFNVAAVPTPVIARPSITPIAESSKPASIAEPSTARAQHGAPPTPTTERTAPLPAEPDTHTPTQTKKKPQVAKAAPAIEVATVPETKVEKAPLPRTDDQPLPAALPLVPPPASPKLVTPTTLDGNRIVGQKLIAPDNVTKAEIARSGIDKLVASFEICITIDGTVSAVSPQKSSGFDAYAAKIRRAIKDWRYRPVMLDGKPTPACASVTFIYIQN